MHEASQKDPAYAPENRVPFRYFSWLLDSQLESRIDINRLLEGIDYSIDSLQDFNVTIEWGVLCQMMSNIERDFSDEELVELGRASFNVSTNRVLTLLVQHILSIRRAFFWAYEAEKGLIPSTYPPLTSSVTETGKHQLLITLKSKPGLSCPRSIYLLTQGQMTSGPNIIGLPDARVSIRMLADGCEYLVDYPVQAGIGGWIREIYQRVFRSKRTMLQLNQSLQEEYRKLDSTLQALKESQSRTKVLSAVSFEGIIFHNDGKILDANTQFEALFGYSKAELVGMPLSKLFKTPEEQVLSDYLMDSRKLRLELTATDKSGQHLDVEIQSRETILEGITVSVTACQDVTERKQMTEKMFERQRRESLGLLAGGIAHDFNNLMATVVGEANLLAKEHTEPDITEALHRITQSAESASAICDQMLAFTGKGNTLFEHINLSQRTLTLLQLINTTIHAKTTLSTDLAEHLPTVLLDPTQLDQIILNLVLNACDAVPETGGRVRVSTCLRQFEPDTLLPGKMLTEQVLKGTYVCLDVTDTGHGIPPDIQGKIFEPFFSTKALGRGMGLPAVLGVVQAAQGGLFLNSSPKGTQFIVALPRSETTGIPAASKSSRSVENHRSKLLIHVIDDDHQIRLLTERSLKKLGHATESFESGEAFLSRMTTNPQAADLVILDLSMKGINGEETLTQFRAMGYKPPVLLISGYHEHGLSPAISADKTIDFLHKPFRLDTLEEKIIQLTASQS